MALLFMEQKYNLPAVLKRKKNYLMHKAAFKTAIKQRKELSLNKAITRENMLRSWNPPVSVQSNDCC